MSAKARRRCSSPSGFGKKTAAQRGVVVVGHLPDDVAGHGLRVAAVVLVRQVGGLHLLEHVVREAVVAQRDRDAALEHARPHRAGPPRCSCSSAADASPRCRFRAGCPSRTRPGARSGRRWTAAPGCRTSAAARPRAGCTCAGFPPRRPCPRPRGCGSRCSAPRRRPRLASSVSSERVSAACRPKEAANCGSGPGGSA